MITVKGKLVMKEVNLVATTHVDKHSIKITKEALDGMAHNYNSGHVYPIKIEHDVTLPPMGKVLRSWVEPLDDGEFGLFIESELFDLQKAELQPDGRVLIGQRSSTDNRPFVERFITPPQEIDLSIDFTNFAQKEHVKEILADDDSIAFTRSDFIRRSALNDPQMVVTLTQGLAHLFIGWKIIEKVQETVGEEIAQDFAKFYRFISDRALLMAKNAIPKNQPITYVFVAPGIPAVEFVVRTTDPQVVAQALRLVTQPTIVAQALEDFTILKPTEVQFLFVDSEWKFNFLLTGDGGVIGIKEGFDRRVRRIELGCDEESEDKIE